MLHTHQRASLFNEDALSSMPFLTHNFFTKPCDGCALASGAWAKRNEPRTAPRLERRQMVHFFCNAPESDSQLHYFGCLVVRTWLEERFGWWTQPGDEEMHAWLLMRLAQPRAEGRQAAIAIDVLSAFDAKRLGARATSHALMNARFKELRWRHRDIREAVPYRTHELRPD